MLQLALVEQAPDWVEALLHGADQAEDQDMKETQAMRNGTPVTILIPNKFRAKKADPDFVRVPGVVVSDPMQASYTSRTSGAVIASANVEVISLRDTTRANPGGGRVWYQLSTEPINLLLRRWDPVTGLDVDAEGQPMGVRDLYARLEGSIVEFRLRQQATRHKAAEAPAEIS